MVHHIQNPTKTFVVVQDLKWECVHVHEYTFVRSWSTCTTLPNTTNVGQRRTNNKVHVDIRATISRNKMDTI